MACTQNPLWVANAFINIMLRTMRVFDILYDNQNYLHGYNGETPKQNSDISFGSNNRCMCSPLGSIT